MKSSKKNKYKTLKPAHVPLLVLFLLLSSRGQAEINMIEGSFRFEKKFQIDDLNLHLAYSSRSNQQGLFGFGWCSNLEHKITRSSTQLLLSQCPYRTPLQFKPHPPPTPVNRLLSMIGNDTIDGDASKPSLEKVFNSADPDGGHIVESSNAWTWYKTDGSWTRFDLSGKVLEDSHVDGSLFEFHYNQRNQLSFIRINKNRTVNLAYSKDDQIIRLELPFSESNLKFAYDNQQLKTVSSFKGILLRFTYDDFENLKSLKDESAASLQTVTYDDKDRAIQHTSGDCAVQFKYLDRTASHLKIQRTKICTKGSAKTSLFHFSFSTRNDLAKVLEKVSITDEEGLRHIHFNPLTGEPLQKQSRFTFDDRQRLTEFSSNDRAVFRLIYNGKKNLPSYIHIHNEGYIKLAWVDSSPQIIDIQPQAHSERLRLRLIEALETITKARKESSE